MGEAASAPGSAGESFRLPSVEMADPGERARVFEALFQVSAPVEYLGRYAVLGTLGSGGMGTVLEAFDRTLDRRVALKILHADLGDRQRLLREAQALAKLSHPNGAGRAQEQLARLLIRLGQYDLAQQTYDAAEASFSGAYGPSSPDAIRVELGRGYLELTRGDLDAAQGHIDRLRARHGVLLEPGSDVDHMVTLVESKLAFMRGDLDAAEAGFGRVAIHGPDNVQRAEAWQAVGVIEFYRGDMVASLDAYDRARAGFMATLGPEHPTLGLLDSNRGESLAASGDHERAQVAFASALDTLERALPPDHADLALPYKGRGQSRLALGALAAARVDLERALRIHEQHPGEPVERADVEFLLAQVMDRSGERGAARTLATSARARLLELGHADRAVAMTRWLDERD